MAGVPRSIPDRIKYYKDRQDAWTTHSGVIGLSAGEMTTMSGKISAAVDGLSARSAAESAAKAATVTLHNADRALQLYGTDLIQKIKAAAGQNSAVYALALIDPPAQPSPVSTLGKPTEFVATLSEDGSLELSWRCSSPRATGVTYQVYRRVNPDGEFVAVGGTGDKKITDSAIPAGATSLTYKIQATRSTAVGPWATFNVTFGASGGTMTASVTPAKLAA